jgi:uncharacterized protein YprB with RNaseH-like and TPR domain
MKLRAYLDIETTGLSRHYADLTVKARKCQQCIERRLANKIGN